MTASPPVKTALAKPAAPPRSAVSRVAVAIAALAVIGVVAMGVLVLRSRSDAAPVPPQAAPEPSDVQPGSTPSASADATHR